MDLNRLFDQFLGTPNQNASGGQQGSNPSANGGQQIQNILNGWTDGKGGGFAGGLATGGILGAVLGNKKMRKKVGKMTGGVVGYGGSAVLGALAMRAYQQWQAGQQSGQQPGPASPQPSQAAAQVPPPSSLKSLPSPDQFDPQQMTASSGKPFPLVLISAMIGAADADGHIDKDERDKIFNAVERMDLAGDEKAAVFDILRDPPSPRELAREANGIEQASEIWLAARLAIDPDDGSEQAWLDALASALNLPADLVTPLEMQVREAQLA